MEPPRKLLLANKAWRTEMKARSSDYFHSLAKDQRPSCLWIGCSDSRVPAEEITGARPGEIFVHRNVANLIHQQDANLLSVVEYAVNFLEVNHVIVCGHRGCGGIRSALNEQNMPHVKQWIDPVQKLIKKHQAELDAIDDFESKVDFIAELNVRAQVEALATTEPMQAAWKSRRAPIIHGWIFEIKQGRLREVHSLDPFDIEDAKSVAAPNMVARPIDLEKPAEM